MKKIFASMVLLMLLLPAVAMAYDEWEAEAIESGSELISTLSNNVTLGCASGGDAYAAISGHASGNKNYASTSGDTKIYSKASDTPATWTDLSNSDTAQFSGSSDWTAL